ncbi:MAG: phosphopantetheine adenylyltransferase [Planctomycetota bacterium]|nr:MAG: phosphopantetheine adenylyltransferase [Planctomycetota bacterium]
MTRTGFFAGSFDPPTLGHVDLVRRAAALVDALVIGVGHNADKRGWIAVEQRVELLRELLPGHTVLAFDGLAVDAARAAGASVLLRGLRGPEDLPGELHMARANARLDPEIDTVFLASDPAIAHVSSRLVREVQRSGGDIELFVPAAVARFLNDTPPGDSA